MVRTFVPGVIRYVTSDNSIAMSNDRLEPPNAIVPRL
jgi:hypothetical protein